jgi:hypothetical protein
MHRYSLQVPLEEALFSADTVLCRSYRNPPSHAFPIRDVSYVGQSPRGVRDLSIYASCYQVPGRSRRGTRSEG